MNLKEFDPRTVGKANLTTPKGKAFIAEYDVKGDKLNITLHIDGLSAPAKALNHPQGGWCYRIGGSVAKKLGAKSYEVFLQHPTAEACYLAQKELEQNSSRVKLASPLTFVVKRTSYFAADMTWEDEVLSPNKERDYWSGAEREAFALAARYLKKTNALYDERLSVQEVAEFSEGQAVTLAQLTAYVRETYRERLAADEDFEGRVMSCEVGQSKGYRTSFTRGYKTEVTYAGIAYTVDQGEEDNSYGEPDADDWMGYTSISPQADAETRKVLLAAFRSAR